MKSKTVWPGIRKRIDGNYLVTKSINKKRFYKQCTTLTEAKRWKNEFNPVQNPTPRATQELKLPVTGKSNGINFEVTFGEVWELYKTHKLGTLGDSIRYRKELKVPRFAASIMTVRMCQISPNVIDSLLDEQKLLAGPKRFNFDEEIRFMKSIFMWYSENYDSSYDPPTRSFHKRRGKVRDIPQKDKAILPDELERFFDALPCFWQRLAYMQFYMAGRIQEAAGLQSAFIFRGRKEIKVANVLTWVKGEPRVKKSTKTGKDSIVFINTHMEDMIDELESERPLKCPFLFHIAGKPLKYFQIHVAYNKAFKKAGLPYSATHVLRYGMAGVSHDFMGEAGAMAATRHADIKMARMYSGRPTKPKLNPENKAVVLHAEAMFYKKKRLAGASKCVLDEIEEAN